MRLVSMTAFLVAIGLAVVEVLGWGSGDSKCTAPWTTRSVHMRHQLLPRGDSEASPYSSGLATRPVNTRFETPAWVFVVCPSEKQTLF